MYSTPPISDSEIRSISKSCPFCGSMRLTVGYDGQPASYFYIRCLQCGASGPSITRSQVLSGGGPIPGKSITDGWNTRK